MCPPDWLMLKCLLSDSPRCRSQCTYATSERALRQSWSEPWPGNSASELSPCNPRQLRKPLARLDPASGPSVRRSSRYERAPSTSDCDASQLVRAVRSLEPCIDQLESALSTLEQSSNSLE